MNLLASFQSHLKERFPKLTADTKILVAVSGGADSIALAHLLMKTGMKVSAAHCNFQLRGDESDRDQQLVEDFAAANDLPLFLKRFDTKRFQEESKLSVQEAARQLRYDWFNELSNEHQIPFIATAHHANDNAETVLMHFFRGTGLKGMTGIPADNGKIIRPLLPFTKNEILEYIKENHLAYAEDSSNSSDKYTRNFFRNELIPAIEKVFPNAQENIIKTTEQLTEAQIIFNEAVEQKKKKLFSSANGKDLTVAIEELRKLSPRNTWLWELFKEYDLHAAQLPELVKLFDAENGSYLQTSSGFRIIKNRNRFIVNKADVIVNEAFVIDDNQSAVDFPMGQLLLKKTESESFNIPADSNICCIDANAVQFPLLLRKWRQGDYFYPLGMRKKKKLSRFFIDQKMSLIDKENTWVIESRQRIVWIVNRRLDDRFKITEKTRSILKIELRVL